MALINKLREKMGRFLVFAVGFAIMSFVLADLLGPNSTILGNTKEIGEIAGNTITFDEFQAQVERLSASYSLNFGRNPSEAELTSIRQQAWEYLIVENAFKKEYDKVGVDVIDEEVVDMVQGRNISAEIKQSFTNPETGEFDRDRLMGYLQSVRNAPAQQQMAWYLFESNLRPSRLRIKYDNLLLKTNYVTEEEAKMEYQNQTSTVSIKYLYVPYFSIDSTAAISESQLQDYLDDHANEYQVENTRSLEYVSFPIEPSPEDTAYFEKEMSEIKAQFETSADDSIFARINSDGLNFFGTYNISNLPLKVAERLESIQVGDIIGPELEGPSLKMYKISAIIEDTVYRAKASHILFKWDEDTPEAKAKARNEARSVLNLLNDGSDFAAMASQYGQDGTASRGGDLGWGTQGTSWVSAFEKPVFSATREGLINRLIETEYGYHIIKVTSVKNNLTFKIAIVEREITPSDDTRNSIFRQAGVFQAKSATASEFTNNANIDSLKINSAGKLTPEQRFVTGLGEARAIVQWLFNTATENQVSDVFELENYYVVAVMTGEEKKGTAKLSEVRYRIEAKLKNQLKAKQIIEKLGGLTGSLEEIAEAYGDDANVYTADEFKLSENFISNVGLAPSAVGVIAVMDEGQRSEPISTDGGVVIAEVISRNDAGEIADYTTYKNQLKQAWDNRTSFGLSEAIKEYSDIKDLRYKFY